MHWHVNYNLPEVEGSFGAAAREVEGHREMHAEVGYAHAHVSKMELVVWPWRNNPKRTLGYSSGSNSDVVKKKGVNGVEVVQDEGDERIKDNDDEDWVVRGLRDLQDHISDLQDWWEERKERKGRKNGGGTV